MALYKSIYYYYYLLLLLNDSEISLSSETTLSLTRISLTGEDLLPLPVSEFISFQPALGS